MFIQLHGIIFIQLQGNDIIVNFQGNVYHSKKIYLFTKNIFIQGNKIRSRNYILGNYIQSRNSIHSIQGHYIHSRNCIHSRKYICSRKLYSFKNVAFPDITEIFIQQVSLATISNKYKLYVYYLLNKVYVQLYYFRVKDEEMADVEVSGL